MALLNTVQNFDSLHDKFVKKINDNYVYVSFDSNLVHKPQQTKLTIRKDIGIKNKPAQKNLRVITK